ncbi:MAG: RluA family pseudouridine synthase [Eubacteriales bacterium]|nr:RluA family pseudouridine synthase [Eubacteriales bacterium]
MILTYTLPPEEDGLPLSRVLRRFSLSGTALTRVKASGALTVNGVCAHTGAVCRAGDTVRVDLSAAEPPMTAVPEDGPLDVLYEDDALLAVDKPAGLLTHPSRAQASDTLLGRASGYLLRHDGCGACHILTRLDRDTSGIVLLAKNAYVCARFTEPPEKTYTALVYGTVFPASGRIDAPIARLSPAGMARGVVPGGAPSGTHWRTLGTAAPRGIPVTALELHPETGRTHQLRVHCAYIGHPLLGDRLYGSTLSRAASALLGIRGHCLRASALSFFHPLTQKRIDLAVPAHTNLPLRID